ncbi:MAG: hypothetical protein WCS77_07830 [Elusimicrobiaceae bacterium]
MKKILSSLVLMAFAGTALLAYGPAGNISATRVEAVIAKLSAAFPADKERSAYGVRQAALLWTEADGTENEFEDFCLKNFYAGADLEKVFLRYEDKFEKVFGYFNSMQLDLRKQIDENTGPLLPVDEVFGGFSPAAHLSDDMFQSKIAFISLLNFRLFNLKEMTSEEEKLTRLEWAKIRLAQRYSHRVPAAVAQELTKAYAGADNYINAYNFNMEYVTDKDGKPVFRKGLKLISHWGLRDELSAMYADPAANLDRQRTIYRVMLRVIGQEVPSVMINGTGHYWNPYTNKVDGKDSALEQNTRYAQLLNVFRAHRMEDKYYPDNPTLPDRRFNLDTEIPEATTEKMFDELLASKSFKETAALISKRLGRPLEPFDLWYDGFKSRGSISETELDALVNKKYPGRAAFAAGIPGILMKLGFDSETAKFLSDHISVDNGRGAGHAWGPEMRGANAHMRVRIPDDSMNYQGFNTAMHELGHCVEQVFSMYKTDYYTLARVPNSAITEGFAFLFQARDLEVLGVSAPDETSRNLHNLDVFWNACEIAGVGLVDMKVWRWMYANPDAAPEDLNKAVRRIATEVWNKYYAPVFGVKDTEILGIYSHMINSGLYLPNYPLGHIMSFQVGEYLDKNGLAKEMERLCRIGQVTPSEWMRLAVGSGISPRPIIDAAGESVKKIAGKN